MARIFFKPKAEADLEEIYEYTYLSWGILQAEKYQNELNEGIQRLIEFPKLGKEYIYSTKQYRVLHINRHLIFYRNHHDDYFIIRILHESMNIEEHI